MQHRRRLFRVSSTGPAVTGVSERQLSMLQESRGDMVEYLLQGARTGNEVSEHGACLCGVIEYAVSVRHATPSSAPVASSASAAGS